MNKSRIIGLVIFAIGAVLLILAYQSSQAPLEELSNTLTGRYSDETTWYFIAGIAAVIGGGLLAVFGRRK